MFHFALIHVSATKFQGPDALSRRTPADGEEIVSDDDSWLDEIALFMQQDWSEMTEEEQNLPSCFMSRQQQESFLHQVYRFLSTLEAPVFDKPQKHARFIQQATRFMIHEGKFLRRNKKGPPLNVILEPARRLKILTQAHEEMGHRGIQPIWDMLKLRFYWPKMYNDIQH